MKDILIQGRGFQLAGILQQPALASGLVLFAHGSGSSHLSPRNQWVAQRLNQASIATLLFDLLTPSEALDRSNVFNIDLLAERLAFATNWVLQTLGQGLTAAKPAIGYFGASTGAAAALIAAAHLGDQISAIVSRGGRPDLAIPYLSAVSAPTLLLVGGLDHGVISLNRTAARHLRNAKTVIIPGATHLFEEPGALEQVAENATKWFRNHLHSGLDSSLALAPAKGLTQGSAPR